MKLDELHLAHIEYLRSLPAAVDQHGLRLGAQYVMFFAEADLMRRHAVALVGQRTHLDVLEVGLGLGVFAEAVAELRIGSYTAVEPHPEVIECAQRRVLKDLPVAAHVYADAWQTVDFSSESFDVIMYDTWPPDGHADADFEAFVGDVAVRCLRPGGRFSFFHSGVEFNRDRLAVLSRHFHDVQFWHHRIPAEELPAEWTKPTGDFIIPVATKAARP